MMFCRGDFWHSSAVVADSHLFGDYAYMASRRHRWLYMPVSFFVVSLVIANTGCGAVPSAVTLRSVVVAPASASIAVDATQQFTATATYSNGSTANVSSTASWTIATPAVATVNSTGLTTGAAAGSSTVTASLSGMTGNASLTVMAPTVTLTSISVTPSVASIAVDATQQFTATATYSNDSTANVTSTASWTIATPAVATVNSTGLTTGAAAGSSTVTASLSGMTGNASVTVMAPTVTLTSISVTPSSASIAVDATQQFTATATYSNGSTANVSSTASWTIATPAVATVNSSGLTTGAAAGSSTVTASLSGMTGNASLTVMAPTVTLTSISVTPSVASIAVDATQQFTATATYSNDSTANVTSTASWTIATPAIATVNSSGLTTGAAAGSTAVTASLNSISGSASLGVTATVAGLTNVAMWHYDAQRTGLNPTETSLSPASVTPQTFGKLFSYLLDGYEYGQPLLMSNLVINGITRNVVFAATENDSVYAFDADNYNNGTPLWQVSLLQPGETPITDGPIQPVEGITSTPVIDTASNTMYVVSVQTLTSTGVSTFRLNALNILTGAQTTGSPVTIQASVPGTNSDSINGVVSLTASCVQRAALLVSTGTVYIGFGGCHSGWLLAYNELTLAQTGVFNASPNLNGEGPYASAGGVWMGGGGPAADDSGNIYITTGNGPWDGVTAWGDSVLKFSSNGQLQMLDYFTPDDYSYMNCHDADLAAGGLLLIPGSTEALAGGKTGVLYLVNTTDLGHEQDNDAGATQTVPGVLIDQGFDPYSSSCTDPPQFGGATWTTNINSYEFFSTPSYFNGSVYVGLTPTSTSIPVGIVQFQYSGTLTAALTSLPAMQLGSNGATAFISANGTANGILWMIDHGEPLQNQDPNGAAPTTATLRAYDPLNLASELYDSGINAEDAPGYGIKFTSPIVANGKVYIGTGHDLTTVPNPQGELDVYGAK
jgi:hypothetical protein